MLHVSDSCIYLVLVLDILLQFLVQKFIPFLPFFCRKVSVRKEAYSPVHLQTISCRLMSTPPEITTVEHFTRLPLVGNLGGRQFFFRAKEEISRKRGL